MVRYGLQDVPAERDLFEITGYINGLQDFILECSTPMTISIQGDWGTGKTSIMNHVAQGIREAAGSRDDILTVNFNTWQFSQFNLGDQLPIIFMRKLISEVSTPESAFKSMAESCLTELLSFGVKKVTGGALDSKTFMEKDVLTTIEKLKDTFQGLVTERATKDRKEDGRVIIFVDDLDRLNPGRAVELLEVLKLFLDCERCVFVLAIDYNVVVSGVKEKYGQDFKEEKGRQFFDKIIQVPFKMPIASYNVEHYIAECFKQIGVKDVSDEDLVKYRNLIGASIGNNPRAMKRLFNSFMLLRKITTEKSLLEGENRILLFAVLCMQSRYERAYNHMISLRSSSADVMEFIQSARDAESPFYKDEADEAVVKQTCAFMGEFFDIIDKDGSGSFDEEEERSFMRVLDFSTVTSAGPEVSSLSEDKQLMLDYMNGFIEKAKESVLFSERFEGIGERKATMSNMLSFASSRPGISFRYQILRGQAAYE